MIKLDNLSKSYGKQQIFDHVNYELPDKGLICILGASGCGKSTLLNLLAGFDCDYEGTIEVNNTSISKMSHSTRCSYRKNNIGFIFQDYNLLTGYSVLENILMASMSTCSEDAIDRKKAENLLVHLNIQDKENEKVELLSGGQKQRVAIIRALINNPEIILADEPTGSLDRKNANEIMLLLKDIAKDRLVILITHDKKICAYAHKTIHIEKKKIVDERNAHYTSQRKLKEDKKRTIPTSKLAFKNLKVHWKSFVPVSIAIALGMLAFLFSLSFTNIMESSISEFKEKNIAYNNGYIKADKDIHKTFTLLKKDDRVENVYLQYVLEPLSLEMDKQTITMNEKYPMPKASQQMSYGRMPKAGKKEISLSPSLAKKFDVNIANLIGKKIQFKHPSTNETLSVSGIFNAAYDDFFLSSDLEQELYKNLNKKEIYALNYDVKEFNNIVSFQQMLKEKNINSITHADEVASLQQTFKNLTHLFTLISIFILSISIFISIVLLVKLQNTRYHEMGLLSALGFNRSTITMMIYKENILLALLAACFNLTSLIPTYFISLHYNWNIYLSQYILSICGTLLIVFIIGIFTSRKLITIEPAQALKK